MAIPLGSYQKQLSQSLPAHLLLWPFASALYLCNAISAAFSRRIKWRGITYELKSATEAVIISRESDFGVRIPAYLAENTVSKVLVCVRGTPLELNSDESPKTNSLRY